MSWTAEVSWINQQLQFGAESTPGTAVAAGKRLNCFDLIFGINPTVSDYTPTGHKYVNVREEDAEQTDLTIGGNLDFNGMTYLAASAMGLVSPTAHGVSATAKDWAFKPPITGSIQPQTYTIQQGDAIRARSVAYATLNQLGYKGTRVTQQTVSATGIAQPLSDGITLTSSPTAIALAPVVSKFFNFYLDSTSSGIGTTQLTRVFGVDFSFGNIAGPFWAYNRSQVGFTGHVDLMPKATIKLLMEADANGMAPLSYLQQGLTYYLRVQAQGAVIDNLQTVSLGSPSAGTFTLTYKAQTTSGIAYNASAATVQTALQGLSTIGAGNATVSGSAGGPYSVIFAGTLGQDTTAMTGSGGGLTGGTFLITQNQSYNTMTHDMAVKFGKPTPFKDEQGIFALEWEAVIGEDPAWNSGQAQILTLTNLLTAL